MQVHLTQFRQKFVAKALPLLERAKVSQESVVNDSVSVSPQLSAQDSSQKRFTQLALAIANSAQIGGIPALAALSQEVAQELIDKEQERAHGEKIAEQLEGLPRVESPRVERAWSEVAEICDSPFPAPEVIDSFFIYAQSDSTGMYLGTSAIDGELADETILKFTLAHEEAHRVHRDSAGARGLELLLELSDGDEKLYPIAMKSLQEGRHQNEREADLYAAQVVRELGLDEGKMYGFLESLHEDLQHPGGLERAAYVRAHSGPPRE